MGRRWLGGSLLVLALAPLLVLAGPAAPGNAAVIDLTRPVPLNIPSTTLGAYGATSATITSAAATASSSGAGLNVTAGTVAAGGGAAASAASALTPVAVVAGGLSIGWGVGRFIGSAACAGGLDAVCWPQKDGYTPNGDVAPVPSDLQGWVGPNSIPAQWMNGAEQGGNASPTLVITQAPAYGQNSGLVGSVTWSGAPAPAATSGWSLAPRMQVQTYCYPAAGGATIMYAAANQLIYGTSQAPLTYQRSAACAADYLFDHLEVWNQVTGPGEVRGKWYPPGHQLRPAAAPTDPQRRWITRGQCVKGADVSFTQAESVVFRESDSVVPKYPDVDCGTAGQLTGLEVRKLTPTLPSPDNDVLVWEWELGVEAPAVQFPECADGTCLLRLQRLVDARWLDCFSRDGLCSGWWASRTAEPALYRCRYGSNTVPLAECNVYRPSFEAEALTGSGVKYANPDGSLGGEPAPDPAPDDEGKCPPEPGFLSFLNPFWLFDTLKCAFVPRASVMAADFDSSVDWCSTAPGVLACSAGAVVEPFTQLGAGDTSDCKGAEVTLPNTLNDDPAQDGKINPFSACSPAMAQVSGFWISFSSGAIYLGAILLGTRMLARTIGADDAVPA